MENIKAPKVKNVMHTPNVISQQVPEVSTSSLMNFGQNRMLLGMIVLMIMAIAMFMWLLMKRTKKLEREYKNTQKINNEVTNLKYGLQDTVNAVQELRQRNVLNTIDNKHNKKSKQELTQKVMVPEPVKVPKMAQFKTTVNKPVEEIETERIEIESVNSDDIDGETEIIELEEGSDESDNDESDNDESDNDMEEKEL